MAEHEQPVPAQERPQSRPGRRRFLGGLGASGLAAAVAVFGRADPAYALVTVVCCHLCFSPSHSEQECETGRHYVWTCGRTVNGRLQQCWCCEHGVTTATCTGVQYSSALCFT
jgi:hypothetical protein